MAWHDVTWQSSAVRSLLQLLEAQRDPAPREARWVVAACFMCAVGRHTRFLATHWGALHTTVHKLLEFMHEPQPAVQVGVRVYVRVYACVSVPVCWCVKLCLCLCVYVCVYVCVCVFFDLLARVC